MDGAGTPNRDGNLPSTPTSQPPHPDQGPTTRSSKKRLRTVDEKMGVQKSPVKKTLRRNSVGAATPAPAHAQQSSAPPPIPQNPGPQQNSAGATAPDSDYATKSFMLDLEKRLTDGFKSRLSTIEAHIVENSRQIREIKDGMDDRDSRLEQKISRRVEEETRAMDEKLRRALVTVRTNPMRGCVSPTSSKNEESYNYHRRTIRLWPVKEPNLLQGVNDFLQSRLKMTGPSLAALGKIVVKKEGAADSRFPEEVVVEFENKDQRDMVKASGKHLAGDSSVGMRINVPGYLMANYRLLSGVGYHIKSSNVDVKRAIKFDDPNRDLMLDIRINNEWQRITPAEARVAAERNPRIKLGPKKLGSGAISALVNQSTRPSSTATSSGAGPPRAEKTPMGGATYNPSGKTESPSATGKKPDNEKKSGSVVEEEITPEEMEAIIVE